MLLLLGKLGSLSTLNISLTFGLQVVAFNGAPNALFHFLVNPVGAPYSPKCRFLVEPEHFHPDRDQLSMVSVPMPGRRQPCDGKVGQDLQVRGNRRVTHRLGDVQPDPFPQPIRFVDQQSRRVPNNRVGSVLDEHGTREVPGTKLATENILFQLLWVVDKPDVASRLVDRRNLCAPPVPIPGKQA